MNMKFFATTAAAALLLAAPAMAATLDNFQAVQIAADKESFPGQSMSVDTTGNGYLGTSRTFEVTNTKAPRPTSTQSTILESGGGLLTFSNVGGARGTAKLTYADFGLNVDTSKGGFTFNLSPDVVFDGNAVFTLTGSDNGSGSLFYTENLPSGFSPVLLFTQITGYDTFNFNKIASLSFSISSADTADSIDGALTSIDVSTVPVPASGLLLLGAFGGAAALRRRKAKKAA